MKNTSETNISNSTFSFRLEFPSKVEGITFCIAFGLETILIVVGNLLTVALFAVDKKLQKKSLLLVINMAFADLLFGAVFLPLDVYFLAGHYQLWKARLNTPLYIFHRIVQVILSQVTVISAALIACERFYALYWPLKHRTLSAQVYHIVMFMTWTLGVLVGFLMYFLPMMSLKGRQSSFSLLSYYLVLFLIVCGCNIGIWRKFQHRNIAFQPRKRTQHQRLTKTLLFVAVFGLMSLLPVVIVYFLMSFYAVAIHWSLIQTLRLLCFSNAVVNPIVYALRIPEFRQALGLCCFGRRAVIVHSEGDKRRDNRAATSVAGTRLRTLRTDPSHLV